MIPFEHRSLHRHLYLLSTGMSQRRSSSTLSASSSLLDIFIHLHISRFVLRNFIRFAFESILFYQV